MGISASKRVNRCLRNSSEFNSACNSVYDATLSLAQQAFPGIKPYQLFSAVENLHHTLYTKNSIPLITKWVSSPPSRELVHRSFKALLSRRKSVQEDESEIVLGKEEFKEFAIEVFTEAAVSNARNDILKKFLIGVAGIAGVGIVVRPGKEVVGTAIGVYTLGVATADYMSLTG